MLGIGRLYDLRKFSFVSATVGGTSPVVATHRTTEREPRRDLALSTTAPETAAAVDDGLHSAAPRSAAKGSDDMAAMRYYSGTTGGCFAGLGGGWSAPPTRAKW